MSSIHLKQCVQTNSVFDFLQEIVSKVPDIGAETTGEERISGRRSNLLRAFCLSAESIQMETIVMRRC